MACVTGNKDCSKESPSSSEGHNSATSSSSAGTNNRRNQKRTPKACRRCKQKKCKCDGESPCKRCLSDDENCSFAPIEKGVKKYRIQHVNSLVDLNKKLREALNKLQAETKYLNIQPQNAEGTKYSMHMILEALGLLGGRDRQLGREFFDTPINNLEGEAIPEGELGTQLGQAQGQPTQHLNPPQQPTEAQLIPTQLPPAQQFVPSRTAPAQQFNPPQYPSEAQIIPTQPLPVPQFNQPQHPSEVQFINCQPPLAQQFIPPQQPAETQFIPTQPSPPLQYPMSQHPAGPQFIPVQQHLGPHFSQPQFSYGTQLDTSSPSNAFFDSINADDLANLNLNPALLNSANSVNMPFDYGPVMQAPQQPVRYTDDNIQGADNVERIASDDVLFGEFMAQAIVDDLGQQ